MFMFFILSIGESYALGWSSTSGTRNCNNDPLTNTSGQKRIPNSTNLSAASSGSVPCSFHGYYSGSWTGWRAKGTNPGGNHYVCPDQRYAASIQYNGANTHYRIYCKYRDDTPPTASDISVGPSVTNRHALHNQTTYIDVSRNGWAPISMIQWNFEHDTPHNTYFRISSNSDLNPLNTERLQINWDISRVDNDGSPNNGKRDYNFSVSYIADEAGNTVGTINSNAVVRNFPYRVYANTFSLGTTSITSNELSNPANVADGSQKDIDITLADSYGNRIVPVSDISRTIDFNISMNNALRKDQYLNSATGNNSSAIFAGTTTNEIRIGNNNGPENTSDFYGITSGGTFHNTSSRNYTIPFYVYAPTNNTNSHVPGTATMNSITFDVNGSLWAVTNRSISNSSFDVYSRPRYFTNFDGELDTQGFIEWANQNSSVLVSQNTGAGVGSPSLRLEYGAVNGAGNNTSNPRFDLQANGTNVAEGPQSGFAGTTQISSSLTNTNIATRMGLQAGGVNESTHSYLASILEFTVWGKQISYPSDILGKPTYHGTTTTNSNSYQAGTKIVGNTTSQQTQEIVTDQFDSSAGTVRILWKFEKSSLKTNLEKGVYQAIRNASITPVSGSTTIPVNRVNSATWNNTGIRNSATLLQDSVLYISNPNGPVRLSSSTISGNKTIIVENGDLYIDGDLENSNSTSILGIIVLGWNIYIDPAVTDIHAIMYTNRSLISYDGSSEIDGNTDASVINDQLYIKGSVFSENTIGGSRKTPAECPYYVNASNCWDSIEAQTYDLNYLRRYFIYDTNDDGVPDARSGNISNATVLDSSLEPYPVIIDYNPQIQQTPPPLFN